MKLLFDHNLSHKLVERLADTFADSGNVGAKAKGSVIAEILTAIKERSE